MKLVVDNTKTKNSKLGARLESGVESIKVGRLTWRYYSKKKEYRRPKNIFYADSVKAYSQGWWQYVSKIGPFVVLDIYNAEPLMERHRDETVALLAHLGIKIDYEIEAPDGLGQLLTAKT